MSKVSPASGSEFPGRPISSPLRNPGGGHWRIASTRLEHGQDARATQEHNTPSERDTTLARISHRGVPLLAARQAVQGASDEHCFCEAVAHCLLPFGAVRNAG